MINNDESIAQIREESAAVTLKVNFTLASERLREMARSPLLKPAEACKIHEMRLQLESLVTRHS